MTLINSYSSRLNTMTGTVNKTVVPNNTTLSAQSKISLTQNSGPIVSISNAARILLTSTPAQTLEEVLQEYDTEGLPPAPVSINDTDVNLFSSFNADVINKLADLFANGKIKDITLTNPAIPISISKSDVPNFFDATLDPSVKDSILSKLTNGEISFQEDLSVEEAINLKAPNANITFSYDVADISTEITNNFEKLSTLQNIGNVSLTDTSPSIRISNQQYTSKQEFLNKIDQTGLSGGFLSIVNPDLKTLNQIVNDTKVSDIVFSGTASYINSFMARIANFSQRLGAGQSISIEVSDNKPLTMTIGQLNSLNLGAVSFSPPATTAITRASFNNLSTIDGILSPSTPSDFTNSISISNVELSDTSDNLKSKLINYSNDPTIIPEAFKLVNKINITDKKEISLPSSDYNNIYENLSLVSNPFTVNISYTNVFDFLSLKELPKNGTIKASISGTQTDIVNNLEKLQLAAKSGRLKAISTSSSTLNLTAEQIKKSPDLIRILNPSTVVNVTDVKASDLPIMLKIPKLGNIKLSDTSNNLNASISTIVSSLRSGKISEINITDGKGLRLSKSQYDTMISNTFLQPGSSFTVAGGFTLTNVTKAQRDNFLNPAAPATPDSRISYFEVLDTATNVSAFLKGAPSNVSKVFIADNKPLSFADTSLLPLAEFEKISGPFSVTIGEDLNATELLTLPSLPKNGRYVNLALSDTDTNIKQNLDKISELFQKGTVSTYNPLPPSNFDLSSTEFNKFLPILSSVSLSDRSNISINLSKVNCSDLGKIIDFPNVSISMISDTADNLGKSINQIKILNDSSRLTNIEIIDKAPLSVSKDQYNSSTSLFTKIGKENLSIYDLKAADVDQLSSANPFSSIVISDSAENLSELISNSNASTFLNQNFKIEINDGKPIALNAHKLDEADIVAILDKVSTPYKISLSSQLGMADIANLDKVPEGASFLPPTLSGSFSDLADNIDQIQSLVAAKSIKNIFITPSTSSNIPVDFYKKYKAVFNLISNPISIGITEAKITDIGQLANDKNVSQISISDKAGEINRNVNSLVNLNRKGKLSAIKVSDSLPINLTRAQSALLASKFPSAPPETSIILNLKSDELTTVDPKFNVIGVNINDTAANISTNLNNINTLAEPVLSISVSDGAPIRVLYNDFVSNSDLFKLVSKTTKVALSDTTLTVQYARDFVGKANNTTFSPVVVRDTDTNILSNIDALQGLSKSGSISKVIFSNSPATFAINYDKFKQSPDLFNAISGKYSLALRNTPASEIGLLASNPFISNISILDSASNILSSREQIQNFVNLSKILAPATITPTDFGVKLTDTANVTVTAEQKDWLLNLPGFYDAGNLRVT